MHITIGVSKKQIANQTVSKALRIVDSHGGPKRWRYSVEMRNDLTISAPTKLPLIALNSVLGYKGKQTDPQAVGRELGVRVRPIRRRGCMKRPSRS